MIRRWFTSIRPEVRIDPFKESKFYILQPNEYCKILVNAKQTERIGPPHGIKCSTRDPFVRSKGLNVPYRQQNCENSCMAKKILDRDGKVSMQHLPREGMQCWLDENGELATEGRFVKRWCNYTAMDTTNGHPGKVMTMEAIAWLNESVNATGCPCFPPCHGIDYDVFLTTLANPFKGRIIDKAFNSCFEVCAFQIF